MSDTYGELLRIKHYREHLATQALRRVQQRFDQQARIVQQARDEVVAFHAQRLREEHQQFEAIRHQLIAVEMLTGMNREAAEQREREALLNQRVLDEQQQLERVRHELEAARAHQATSVRECEKFAQFVAVQRRIEEREQMQREEQELEESASAAQQQRLVWF